MRNNIYLWFFCSVVVTFALEYVFNKLVIFMQTGRLSFEGDVEALDSHSLSACCAKMKEQYVANVIMVLLSGLGLGICSLSLAMGSYPGEIEYGWLDTPLILVLNLLPVILLELILYTLTRRSGLAFGITVTVVLGLSVGNYYKLMFRDDPLMFADLFFLKEAGNMAERYHLFLDGKLITTIAYVMVAAIALRFFAQKRVQWLSRLNIGLMCLSMAGMACLVPALLNNTLYTTYTAYYEYIPSQWSDTQRYISRGFIYPFVHSIAYTLESPPEGYQATEAAKCLDSYPNTNIPEDKKVNVIGIMLEAYNDFTKFGISADEDVYRVWHDLEEEGYSGELVTNIFSGGTVDTERSFLTGYRASYGFRGNVNSYPWYFRAQGYKVEGMHPCYQWFYNRQNVNQYLGFEEYMFVENYFSPLTDGKVGMDDIFFPELLKTYQEATKGDRPYFNFSVTYQGHGPYSSGYYMWGEPGAFLRNDGAFTEEQQCILENYLGSIWNTNDNLKRFTDFLRVDPKPVVLVLFGDHNPWMGNGNEVYTAMGVDFDMDTENGFMDYYNTRYIIWANEAAKEIIGNDFRGEGPAIGPYFLMNQLFELCGLDGPSYLQALGDISKKVQVIHTSGVCMRDGSFVEESDVEANQAITEFQFLEYYERKQPFGDRYK